MTAKGTTAAMRRDPGSRRGIDVYTPNPRMLLSGKMFSSSCRAPCTSTR